MTEQKKKTRRGNNEGSIRERKDRGYWEAQITIGGKRVTKTFPTFTEAQKWKREMQNQAEVGLSVETARLPVKDALTKWLESGKHSNWQPKTYSRYSEITRLHILPYVKPRLKLIDVKPDHVDAIMTAARENGAGTRTQQYILATLHKFFQYYVKRRVIPYNPAAAVDKIGYKAPEMMTWSKEQVQTFLKAAEGHRYEHLFYVAIVTGMRQGELLGLKWSDVNYDSGSLQVQRQVQWVDHPVEGEPRFFFKTPKSETSERRIPIGSETIKHLKLQQQQVTMQKMISGKKWQAHDLVFPNLVGNPIDPNNLIKDFRKLLESAGLPKIRFHDIRHTCATLLLLMNVHPKIVGERLGHTDIKVTLRIYSHALPSLQGEASQIIEDLVMGGANPSPKAPQPVNRPAHDVLDF
jgi:integrase